MVQYIHTPWRDREELLRVRQQFYPLSSRPFTHTHANNATTTVPRSRDEDADRAHATLTTALDTERRQQQAVSRVSMWMQRGGCPHLVESTALLVAAVLSDLHESRTKANSSSYAIRAAYSAAFSRFVTGLLDGQQDKLRKMSMYSIAKTIGLPATFVELRHQATHEQLPSLSKLRSAANDALAWIWQFYWKDLGLADKGGQGEGNQSDPRRNLLLKYLREQDGAPTVDFQSQFKSWDESSLLQTLAEIAESSEELKVILRALQLSRTILSDSFEVPLPVISRAYRRTTDLEAVRVELRALNDELKDAQIQHVDQQAVAPDEATSQSLGWTHYQGTWTPKPIGMV
ncbi:Las1-like-domain-containing protein [Xylaria grammica]|nr:Las1-like-domain-containing protein [Xylaria grammica]